ncbi:MAG TPA: YciI family protein [Candidatus Limnocylindria bacterium]|nr:YciI family protein [Candidatus Limnocylindria bacterium]
MRSVLMNYVHPDDATAYYALTPEEQQADVERHIAWFRKHGEHIVGGEELGEPQRVKTLRRGRQGEGVVVTDGPFVETKELLGGFVILETDTLEQALAIASEWPSLTSQPNATVQLHPVYERG